MNKCVLTNTFDLIGKKWAVPIIFEIYKGKEELKRFNYIKGRLNGITSKMLSLRLKELEESGIISKKVNISETPVKVSYRLTKKGKDFIRVVFEMKKWALIGGKNTVCGKKECRYCEN
jgi:DNA-binding HxlR family transcriptional regulator